MTLIRPIEPNDMIDEPAEDTPEPPGGGPPDEPTTPAWEVIGTPLGNARTGPEALGRAGLDWEVRQWPVQATDPQSWKTAPLSDHLANVRCDTREVLGVVGRGYRLFQNRQLFEFLSALAADRLVSFHAAGVLRGGRKVWVVCRLPREFRAGSGGSDGAGGADVVRPYLLMANSHDGDGPPSMSAATVRDGCSNCFNLPVTGGALSVRHHPNLGRDLAGARRDLGLIASRFEAFGRELAALSATPLPPPEAEEYFDAVLPAVEGQREDPGRRKVLGRLRANYLREGFRSPRNGSGGTGGSAWGAFNAVSEWADHQRPFRGRDERARGEARLEAVWFGSSHRIKLAAYRHALGPAGLN